MSEPKPHHPLTPDELEILNLLAQANMKFNAITSAKFIGHGRNEFEAALRQAQQLVLNRVFEREWPVSFSDNPPRIHIWVDDEGARP